MTQPDLQFVQRVNAARHDKAFQFFLARSFGFKHVATEDGYTCVAYHWRGITYITQFFRSQP